MINNIFTPFLQIFKIVLEISFQWLIRVVIRCVESDFYILKCFRQLFHNILHSLGQILPGGTGCYFKSFFSIIGIVKCNWMIILNKV